VEGRTKQLEAEVVSLREAKAQSERRLAAEEQKASRVPELERALANQNGQMERLREAKVEADKAHSEKAAFLEEKTALAERLRNVVEVMEGQLAAARSEGADFRARLATMTEALDQERKQSEEKLALLGEAKDRMKQEFRVLAEEVMRSHGETFSKQNKEQVEGILTPLREKMAEFRQNLQNAHTESAKDRATLAEQIRALTETSAKMTDETHNLTRALKGQAQTQGAWGEMILSTILERSGLREGEEYVTQESHSTDDGARLRPDVVVNLPDGRRIVIDSKVSLTAFQAYVNAETDAELTANLKAHLASIRTHIRSLAQKEYQTVIRSGLDYVIMFVPIEGALAAALQEDPSVTGFAVESSVAIATPTTLMIALRTVANVWQAERRNRNAEAIAEHAGRIYDKFVGFLGDMGELGTRLGKARESYEGAMGKLSTGKGNLIRQVEQLKEMGAKTGKSIPHGLLEDVRAEALRKPEAETARAPA
jgi:DNA recombination protein RmuC